MQPTSHIEADGALPRRSSRSLWIERAAIFGFWTFLAVLIAGRTVLDPFRGEPLSADSLGQVLPVFLNMYLWALLTPVIFRISRHFSIDRDNWVSRVPMHLVIAFVIAIAIDLYDDALRVFWFPRPGGPGPRDVGFNPMMAITRLWFLNELITYLAVLAAGFARDYFLRYQARLEESAWLRAHADRLQAQLSEARLQALRMQINPHFLFNTLHAVSSLVERDPGGVRRMIARLSELLRYTLEDGSEAEVTLRQELNFLDRYLEIQRIRFQGRLEVEVDVDDDVEDALIPNLILQPIVENAVKHGASKAEGLGRVSIRAYRQDDRIVMTVVDNGPGLEENTLPHEHRGFDLRNTRARLEELYGDSFQLNFTSQFGSGLEAEISVPYHTDRNMQTASPIPSNYEYDRQR